MTKYSKDGNVCFDPEKHTYLLGDKYLEGVTTFISRHKNEFDLDRIAGEYAEKRGLIKEYVIRNWGFKGKYSCDQGTATHNVFENYFNTGEIINTGKYWKEAIAEKFIKDYFISGRLVPVECEMIVYNEFLASQIDLIAKNKNNDHFIFDWKTNDEIDYVSFKDKRMLHPFENYPDCSFYHYSIQVCIYKELCKEYNINNIFIVHIADFDYKIIKPQKINIPKNILNYEQRKHFEKV